MSAKEPVPVPASADDTRFRALFLECLAKDTEIRFALRDLITAVASEVLQNIPDAETHQNILDLIDKRLVQQIRADAFRRPVVSTTARL